jgi:hypothetical protein
MNRFALLFLLCGCSLGMKHRFVRTDESYSPSPRSQSPKVVEQKDDSLFRCVGVLEVQGNQHDTLQSFLSRVTDAGAEAGCELLIQSDQFDLTAKHNLTSQSGDEPEWLPSRWWYANDASVWQFLCGVAPATEGEATETLEQATEMATRMRVAELRARFR